MHTYLIAHFFVTDLPIKHHQYFQCCQLKNDTCTCTCAIARALAAKDSVEIKDVTHQPMTHRLLRFQIPSLGPLIGGS